MSNFKSMQVKKETLKELKLIAMDNDFTLYEAVELLVDVYQEYKKREIMVFARKNI
jgi:hypothetical protein